MFDKSVQRLQLPLGNFRLLGLGNALRSTVYLGKEGLSAAVIRSPNEAYANSELVKVRYERNSPLDRREAGEQLAAATESHLVQVLGNTLLLYRPDPDDPKSRCPNRGTGFR